MSSCRHRKDELAPMLSVLPKLFALLAKEREIDLCLDIWLAITDKLKIDTDCLRALIVAFDLSDAATLAANMQLSTRRPILDRIWHAFESEDRKMRISAGYGVMKLR